MAARQFNPFEDRLSRDIRNDLSESIIEVFGSRSIAPAEKVARRYEALGLAAHYRTYIDSRLERYRTALAALPRDSGNPVEIAALLWDLGLFFEVHEILEPAWMAAAGDDKRLLQALIRAAGVYINLELGYTERAAKISRKAVPVLRELRQRLSRSIAVEPLIEALEALSFPPPPIGPSGAAK